MRQDHIKAVAVQLVSIQTFSLRQQAINKNLTFPEEQNS